MPQVHLQAARQGLQKGGEGRESRKAEGTPVIAPQLRRRSCSMRLVRSRAEMGGCAQHVDAHVQVKKAIEKDQIDNAKIYAQVSPVCAWCGLSRGQLSSATCLSPCPDMEQA